MQNSTLWWIAVGLLLAAELLTGTFFLLMLGLGAAAGALAAHAGAGATAQLVVAAVVAAGSVAAWAAQRARPSATVAPETNPDVQLDVGATVHVVAWDAERRTTVYHRGAQWQAMATGGATLAPGTWRIVAIQGSQLVLEPLSSS